MEYGKETSNDYIIKGLDVLGYYPNDGESME